MPVTMIDGPGGLEFTHNWAPGDGSTAVLMNKLLTTDLSTVLLPRIKFEAMPGFRSLPDAQDNRQDRTARIGESTLPSMARGKTFTINGKLQAANMTDLRGLERQMLAAFGERDLEGTWSAIPLAAWDTVNAGTKYWQATMRVLQYEPQTDFPAGVNALPTPYQLPFLLGMRMSDPRWSWSDPVVGASNPTSVVATNLGNAPAEPTITVTVPTDPVIITNTTTGGILYFTGFSPGMGTLTINFAARSAVFAIGSVDAMPFFSSLGSTWWDRGQPGLKAGANTIQLFGGSSIQVTHRHAAW